ncbi:hypothetical protein [Clostridium sp.]|uniref:hypothetical protein n=1 Tax=Clostridium sp. TaxID=1506 RepID=UPI00260A0487|nr:hypothetical protein [Clostridium sp.]
MKVRKYQYYNVEVLNNEDGSKESIEMLNNNEVFDNTDYNEMLKVYKKVKKNYKKQNVTIHFCGSTDNSAMNVIYSKVYTREDNSESNMNSECMIKEPNNKNLYDLFGDMNNLIKTINNRISYCNDLIGAYDKSINVEEHRLEALPKKNLYEMTEDDKTTILNISIELQSILQLRRETKNEVVLSQTLQLPNVGMFKSMENANKKIQEYISKAIARIENKNEICKGNKVETNANSIIEKKYHNFKERINIMKELEKTCDKVTYDETREMVIGYNKIYK